MNSRMIQKLEQIQKYLLLSLLIILPYHYLVICVLLQNIGILKIWKELIIFVIFIIALYKEFLRKKIFKFNRTDKLIIVFLIILILNILFGRSKIIEGISAARVYFFPLMLFYSICRCSLNKNEIYFGLKCISVNAALISIYAVLQAQILGDEFLIKLGYPLNEIYDYPRLTNSLYLSGLGRFQRATGTFVSPNTFGLYLVIVFTLLFYLYKEFNMNYKKVFVLLSCIFLGIIFSFSRSSWLTLICGIIPYFIFKITWTKKFICNLIKTIIVISIIVFILDGIILNFTLFNTISHLIISTLTFSDTSINGHINSLVDSFKVLDGKWIKGLGLGLNGPRGLNFTSYATLTESSYFLIIFEVGLIGFISYYSIYISILFDYVKKYIKDCKISFLLGITIVLEILISYLFLPNVQEFEILVYFFSLTACFYLNFYKKEELDDCYL